MVLFKYSENHAPIVSTLSKGQIIIQGEISFHAEILSDKYKINKEKKKSLYKLNQD